MSDPVLALGEELVAELGLNDSCDTLQLWMAHYIAEKIDAADTATGAERDDAQRQCAEAIYGLSEHRASLPRRRLPLPELNRMVEMLERMNPSQFNFSHFRRPQNIDTSEAKVSQDASRLLELIEDLSEVIGVVVGTIMEDAASTISEQSVPWLELADEAEASDGPDMKLSRLLVRIGRDGFEKSRSRASEIEQRLKQLEALEKVGLAVRTELQSKLNAIQQ